MDLNPVYKKTTRLGKAVMDGGIIGMDPIGTVLGYITKSDHFVGYKVNKYSDQTALPGQKIKPINRSIDENIAKCLGIGCGIILSVGSIGITQLIHLLDAADNYSNAEPVREYKKAELEPYVNQWVALDNQKVIGHGSSPKEARKDTIGIEPLVLYVSKDMLRTDTIRIGL